MKLPIQYFTLAAVVLIVFTSAAKSDSESENGEVPSKKGKKSKQDFKRRSHGNGNQKKSFLRRHENQPGNFQWNQENQKFQSLDSASLQYGCTCSCPLSLSPYNQNQNQNQQQQLVAGQQNFPQLSQTGQTFPQGASTNFVGPAPLVQPFIPPSQGQSQGHLPPAAWQGQGQGQGHSAQSAWQSTDSVRLPFPSESTDVPVTRSTLNTLRSSKGPEPTPAPALDTSMSTSENPTTQKATSTSQPTTHAQSEESSSNGNYEAESSTWDIPYSSVPLPTSNAKVENGSVPISTYATSEPSDASRMTTMAHSVITADSSAADDSTTATTTTTEEPAASSVQSDADAVREIENNFYGTINNNVDDYGNSDYYLPIFSFDYDEALVI